MHQLTVFEMEEISGGALTDTLSDIATGLFKKLAPSRLGLLWELLQVQHLQAAGVA